MAATAKTIEQVKSIGGEYLKVEVDEVIRNFFVRQPVLWVD